MSNKFKKISSYDTINDCEGFNTLLGAINNKTCLSPLKKISIDTKWDQCVCSNVNTVEEYIDCTAGDYKEPGFLNVAYEVLDFDCNTIIGQQDILLPGTYDNYKESFLINKTDTDMTFLTLETYNKNCLYMSARTISKRPTPLFAETKATLKSLVLDDKTIYYTNDFYEVNFEGSYLYDIIIDDNIVYTGSIFKLDYAWMIEYEDDNIHVIAGERCYINEEDGTLVTAERYGSTDCLAIEIKNSNFDFNKVKVCQHFEAPGTIICTADFSDFVLSTDGTYYYANLEKSAEMEQYQQYFVFVDNNFMGEEEAYYSSDNYSYLSSSFSDETTYILYQDNTIMDGDRNMTADENSCFVKVALYDDAPGELPSFNNIKIIKTSYDPVNKYLVNFSDMVPVNVEGKSIFIKKELGSIADFRYEMPYDIFVNGEKIGTSEFMTPPYYGYIHFENDDLAILAADGLCDYSEEEAFVGYAQQYRTILAVEKKSNDLSIETIELRLPEGYLEFYSYYGDLPHIALRSIHYYPIDCLKDKTPFDNIDWQA